MNDNLKVTDSLTFKTGKGFSEGLYLDVNMHLQLFDENGILKDERFIHNTVTTAGKNMIADRLLAAPTLGVPTHMAIGTNTPSGTLLGAEVARVALTSKLRSNAVVTMVGDFGPGVGTSVVTEAGVFDIVTANTVNMHLSSSFAAINKLAADSLSISWALTIS